MSDKLHHSEIVGAISYYAEAYEGLEVLQCRESKKPDHQSLLPHKGDQKTGLIGEYWAIRYARTLYPGSQISFGGHSNKGWDIMVEAVDTKPHYIQVKTASAFGSGSLSQVWQPSRKPSAEDGQELPDFWNELWLLWLGRDLMPVTLWKLLPEHINFGSEPSLKGLSIRRTPDEGRTGSKCIAWDSAEAVSDLLTLVTRD